MLENMLFIPTISLYCYRPVCLTCPHVGHWLFFLLKQVVCAGKWRTSPRNLPSKFESSSLSFFSANRLWAQQFFLWLIFLSILFISLVPSWITLDFMLHGFVNFPTGQNYLLDYNTITRRPIQHSELMVTSSKPSHGHVTTTRCPIRQILELLVTFLSENFRFHRHSYMPSSGILSFWSPPQNHHMVTSETTCRPFRQHLSWCSPPQNHHGQNPST